MGHRLLPVGADWALPISCLLLLTACQMRQEVALPARLQPLATVTPTSLPDGNEMAELLQGAAMSGSARLGGDAGTPASAPSVLEAVAAANVQFPDLPGNTFGETLSAGPDWRPPPYEAPLAIHPNDHYWLQRPIPSTFRNYDLPWYPYGSDVLVEEAAPYRIHHGLDFPNDTGTPVLAAGSGEVIHAGPLPSNRDGVNYYGNTVIVRHDWEWGGKTVYTLYAHTLELFVQVGDDVQAGQLLAGVGQSGEVSGPHLHFEVRVGDNHYHSTRNPALWIAPYQGWGTLAGRFSDERGRPITSAPVLVQSLDGRIQRLSRTYAYEAVVSDEVWGENFAVADLPAGNYRIELEANGERFERLIDVQPGRTNFIAVQAGFEFVPTPTPTVTLTPTLSLTATVPLTPTLP